VSAVAAIGDGGSIGSSFCGESGGEWKKKDFGVGSALDSGGSTSIRMRVGFVSGREIDLDD
jgi:hypothetical protein